MPFRISSLSLLSVLLLTFSCSYSRSALHEPPRTLPVSAPVIAAGLPSVRESVLAEPVFHGQVFITQAGTETNESVVLVHGAGDRASLDWEKLIPALATRYHVIALDLPGFGRSSKGNHFYSPARYAELLHWVAERLVSGRFVLIGHSLGAAVALRYAADYPDDLRRLILVDAAGILNRVSYAKELYLMNDSRDPAPSRPKEEFEEFLRFMLDRIMNDDRAKKLENTLQDASVRERVLGGDPKKIAAMALALEDFGPVVEEVRTPTLLIWGSEDRIAPLRTAKALSARLPDARLILIQGAGHVPMMEKPEEFNKVILNDLNGPPVIPVSRAVEQPADESGDRVVHYENRRGISLSGRFKQIELDNCDDVFIRDATIGRLIARRSDIVIENSRIAGSGEGLIARRCDIIATAVTIEAETAIRADKSHLDLAGVTLIGSQAALSTSSNALILFSFSHVESPGYSGPLHGMWRISKKNSL